MKIIDITRLLSENSLVYPGDIRPSFSQEEKGQYRISNLNLSTHSGTHIDAPSHYLKNGGTIDSVPLTKLIGRCGVRDVRDAGRDINADHLAGKLKGITRLLLKTSFSETGQFSEDYPALTADAANMITDQEIQCIGIDSPSIESYSGDGSIHRQLLSNGCIIIELLHLSQIEEGDYEMVALPLRLEGLDGSPARVVLMQP